MGKILVSGRVLPADVTESVLQILTTSKFIQGFAYDDNRETITIKALTTFKAQMVSLKATIESVMKKADPTVKAGAIDAVYQAKLDAKMECWIESAEDQPADAITTRSRLLKYADDWLGVYNTTSKFNSPCDFSSAYVTLKTTIVRKGKTVSTTAPSNMDDIA